MEIFSEKDLSKQESLTKARLNKISNIYQNWPNRPKESLVELMQWAKVNIAKLPNNKNTKFEVIIQNKISIDGSFFQFSEENNIEITPIHTDAITSWDNENNDEHFVGMGIFKIYDKSIELEFYQCSLFHKGNSNEDEVSFFVVIDIDKFEKYLSFRNKYVEWQKNRDRNNKEIEVIGGSPIPYDTNLSWDDLYLPNELKNKIITSVNGFLTSKEIYDELKVPWKIGLGFWGSPGVGKTLCLKVLMAQFPQLKPITIQQGHASADDLLEEAFFYAEEHSPSLLFFEDLQELIKTIDPRHFLQLLDGVQKRDGIVTIVTGNDFSDLEENIKSRPRRFDKFFEFPLPDVEQSKNYLSKYFNELLNDNNINSIVKQCVKNKLTYAHLQEIYFNSVFIALSDNKKKPSIEDIKLSLKQVIEEKKISEADFIKSSRDLADDM